MAEQVWTDYADLSAAADGDTLLMLDVSDVTDDAAGTVTEITRTNFFKDCPDIGGNTVTAPTSALHLPLENDAVTPTLAFGDGDTGLYEINDDQIGFASAGTRVAVLNNAASGSFYIDQGEKPLMSASATQANFSSQNDNDTGMRIPGGDIIELRAHAAAVLYVSDAAGRSGVGVEMTPETLTSGGTGDAALKIGQTLNDTGAAGGTDVYRGIWLNVTETDVTGWDNVFLIDLEVGGTRQFAVENDGIVHFGTFTSTADTATNGYITIKDAGGTSRRLATVA